MYRTAGSIVTVVALYISAFVPNKLSARDDGRYANSPLKQWFDRLASGKGLCCSFADGVSVLRTSTLTVVADDFHPLINRVLFDLHNRHKLTFRNATTGSINFLSSVSSVAMCTLLSLLMILGKVP